MSRSFILALIDTSYTCTTSYKLSISFCFRRHHTATYRTLQTTTDGDGRNTVA